MAHYIVNATSLTLTVAFQQFHDHLYRTTLNHIHVSLHEHNHMNIMNTIA